MFRTTAGGSFSKNDSENSLSREESSSLIDGEDANERLPLRDVRSFPRKKSSTFSSKSPDGESTPSDGKLGSSVTGNKATKNSAEHTDVFRFSPVNENRESSVIAEDRESSTKNKEINVEYQDNHPEKRFMSMPNWGLRNKSNSNRASDLACTINGSNTNEVPYIKVMKPSEKYHKLQRGGHLNHELGSTSNLNRADGSGGNMNEEPLLKRPYNSNDSYKYRYFKDKEESEKPLSKVINTKNREKKDVITLLIEGDNPECISAAFERLTREDFNRKGERGYTPLHEAVRLKSSNAVKALLESEHVDVEFLDERFYKARKYIDDKETAKLFIEYYDRKISNLSREIASSDKKLVRIECALCTTKCIFGFLAASGSVVKIYEDRNADAKHDTIINDLGSLGSAAGLFVSVNYCIDAALSFYRKKNSSLRKERENCVEERYKVETRLFDLRKEEAPSHTGTGLAVPRTFQTASTSASVYSPERVT